VPDLARLQGLKPGTVRHALIALAEDGVIEIRQGTTATVIGEPGPEDNPDGQPARARLGHDCRLSGCKPHACKPMARSTIRNIHAILSGAFDAAQRWEWIDRNPADSAKPPTVTQKKKSATPPADLVKVIGQAHATGQRDVALYIWLAAITGARRAELCALQIRDIDLDNGVVHIAFNYVVRGGRKLRTRSLRCTAGSIPARGDERQCGRHRGPGGQPGGTGAGVNTWRTSGLGYRCTWSCGLAEHAFAGRAGAVRRPEGRGR